MTQTGIFDQLNPFKKVGMPGIHSFSWKGGIWKSGGYRFLLSPGHPRALGNGYAPESVLIVEKALGKYLPLPSIVHHVDGNRSNNTNRNLIVCQDESYHHLIHIRTRALRECGDARKRKCLFCKQYDDVSNLFLSKTHHTSAYHRECRAAYFKAYEMKRKGVVT